MENGKWKMVNGRAGTALIAFLTFSIFHFPFSIAQEPSTHPAPSGYGREKFRFVNQPDEIVSVLANGATVIVKRVPSPVAAVRGYVYTGGVYEGQWLGGGLSHLLEHLVAG